MGKEPRRKSLSDLMFTHRFTMVMPYNKTLHQNHYGRQRGCRKCAKEIHKERVVYSYRPHGTRLTPIGMKILVPASAALLGVLGVLGNMVLEYFNFI